MEGKRHFSRNPQFSLMNGNARHIQILCVRLTRFLGKTAQKAEQRRLHKLFKILAVAKDVLTEYALRYGVFRRRRQRKDRTDQILPNIRLLGQKSGELVPCEKFSRLAAECPHPCQRARIQNRKRRTVLLHAHKRHRAPHTRIELRCICGKQDALDMSRAMPLPYNMNQSLLRKFLHCSMDRLTLIQIHLIRIGGGKLGLQQTKLRASPRPADSG